MKIIKPSVELIKFNNPLINVEIAGRTCYKSNSDASIEGAVNFAKKMYEHQHTAMLEHGIMYMRVPALIDVELAEKKYLNRTTGKNGVFVSGSFRTFLELYDAYKASTVRNTCLCELFTALNAKYPDFFEVEPEYQMNNSSIQIFDSDFEFISTVRNEFSANIVDSVISKHVYHTLKFICDRGVTHEIVRHRPASYAQESTRYCKYNLDKFGNEITVIEPLFFEKDSVQYRIWEEQCRSSEKAYNELCEAGATAQEARTVLNNSLKTEIVITATEDEWQHMINLRYHGTTGPAHPQAVEVFGLAYKILVPVSDNRIK